MVFTRIVAVAGLGVWALAVACGGEKKNPNTEGAPATGAAPAPAPADQATEMKDSEVRTYIRDELTPYLDSLAYQVCILKYKVDPSGPGKDVCKGPPDGYKPPPPDGKP